MAQPRAKFRKARTSGDSGVAGRAADRLALWMEAATIEAFWGALSLLPTAAASGLGAWLLRRIGPHLEKSRHLKRNLQLAFPEKPPAEIDALVESAWGNFGAVLAEFPHLKRITRDRLEIVGRENLAAARAGGTPVMFVTGHIGNWELSAAVAQLESAPLSVVYTPQPNPLVDRALQRMRRALGCGFLPSQDGLRPMVRLLSQGISIGLLMDQRVDSGREVPFFGMPSQTTLVPVRIALKHGCPVLPVRVERLPGVRFRVSLLPALSPDDPAAEPDSQVLQVTRKINALFEDWIRDRPDQWYCYKRRWPKSLGRVAANPSIAGE